MSEPPHSHIPQTESLAYLQEAGKVSNYEVPNAADHVTKNPSDLQQVLDAQKVSNADYGFPEESEVNLESGPRKKIINVGNPTDSNTTDNNNNNTDAAAALDAFVPSTDNTEQQNYDSFFGGDANTQNAAAAANANTDDGGDVFAAVAGDAGNNANEDVFGGMDVNENAAENDNSNAEQIDGGGGGGGMNGDVNNSGEIEEKQESKPTFLSVWQEEHREQLAEKAKAERAEKERLTEAGKKALDEFNEQRRLRIEQQHKDAQAREKDLRDDYDSVFKHGTIWQQVAKMVDLQSSKKHIERMKDLLIILKNADEQTGKGDK
mmetsp:Transcript_44409/g.73501  ORF Transcript_44409/g.73501 Transcript_44409/m.73501 type:complete len:320 (+) Transcript_44409:82-1041(+)|eukprot:CAMPEP_0202695370 /NCGR_PEP_ID=MMETSP1385-20130828/8975_1 /ASSEMBLY_ACC=CAM_ASM_000861 /TAXON_ID=933848 /ORGANISM="Elphidium margaritaceum" /LENGTH=319 /DNA_ID=CAMNT_0049351381 /DNA_START=82 /DNA_END=1041 /DNA_ORIENTATION=-